MATERRDVLWRFLGDAKGLDQASKQAQGTLGKVSSTVSKTANAVKAAFAGVAAKALVGFGKDMLDAGAKLASIETRIDTVFGDGAGTIRDWAEASAAAFGTSTSGVLDLAAGLGDLLVPLGFTRDEVTRMVPETLEAANAFSEWTGGTVSATDAADRIQKAMLGERDGLKQLGLSISEADVQTRLLAKGQAGLTGEAEKQAKALATLDLITEGGADALTAYAQGGNEALRASKAADAAMQEMQDTIARELTPSLTTFANVATTSVIPALGGIIETAAGGLDDLADFGDHLEGALGNEAEWRRWAVNSAIDEFNDRIGIGGTRLDAFATAIGRLAREGVLDSSEAFAVLADELGFSNTQMQLGADRALELADRLGLDADATADLTRYTTDYNDATNRMVAAQSETVTETDRMIARFKPLGDAVDDVNDELDEQATLLDDLNAQGQKLTGIAAVTKAQEDLGEALQARNDLIADGITSGPEWEQVQLDLAIAANTVKVATQEAAGAGTLYTSDLIDLAEQAGLAGDALWDFVEAMLAANDAAGGADPGFTKGGNKGYASGTLSALPGAALVGEHGPELVSMRGGERVANAGDTGAMLRAGGPAGGVVINLNVQAGMSSPADTARAIVAALQSYERSNGPLPFTTGGRR